MTRIKRKAQMMELWGKCFDDSPKFIQHFFSCFYRAPRFVTLERDEQVLASLFMLRCHVLYYGHRICGSYIYGVCTHPDYRRQGLMRELIEKACRKAYHRYDSFVCLVPGEDWLFDVYHRMNFLDAFYVKDHESRFPRYGFEAGCIKKAETPDEAWEYLSKKWSEYTIAVIPDKFGFKFRFNDLRNNGGGTYIYQKDGKVSGVVMVQCCEPLTILQELQADTEEIRKDLIGYVAALYPLSTIRYRTAETRGNGRPYGLVRIINPLQLETQWGRNHRYISFDYFMFLQKSMEEQVQLLFHTPPTKNYLPLAMDK